MKLILSNSENALGIDPSVLPRLKIWVINVYTVFCESNATAVVIDTKNIRVMIFLFRTIFLVKISNKIMPMNIAKLCIVYIGWVSNEVVKKIAAIIKFVIVL